MSLSLREISAQQFADGTTIDGVRIDRVMGDFVGLWNLIPKRMLISSLHENTMCGGYMPHPTYNTDRFPWQPAHNSTGAVDVITGRGPAASLGVANEWRNKGFRIQGIDPKDQTVPMTETILMWTNTFWFTKPKILNGIWCNLATDSVYQNNFVYGASPPPGGEEGFPVKDFFLEVSIKNAFLSGVRRLDDILWHRIRFLVKSEYTTVVDWSGVADPLSPAHPEGVPARASTPAQSPWVTIDARHLLLPIPARSSVRFTIGIPLYDTYTTGWGNTIPQSRQYYSWALNILEELF